MTFYIDACHSGSICDVAEKWAKDNGGKVEKDWEHRTGCEVCCFESACYLELMVWTACGSDESANDAGEGKGGLWTNLFTARGVLPPMNKTKWTENKFRIYEEKKEGVVVDT